MPDSSTSDIVSKLLRLSSAVDSADAFLEDAATLGLEEGFVGLTIVAIGTSLPELATSIVAARKNEPEIALGNVIGSNICNVLLILGLSASIAPLVVNQQLVRLDVPVMVGVSCLVLVLGLDGAIGRPEGILLFAGAIAYTTFLGLVAIIPLLFTKFSTLQSTDLLISGSGLIIIVGVVMELIRQVNAQMLAHDYEKLV